MIPRDYITQWRERAPWSEDFQVEQDLIISRALVEMFSDPVLAGTLAFRGGTALYKLYAARGKSGASGLLCPAIASASTSAVRPSPSDCASWNTTPMR